MIIIPAIDLMDGRVVRLKKGKKEDYRVYSENPVSVLKNFEKMGAKRIHIVDLDNAFNEGKDNVDIIKKMSEVATADIEVGGGIRSIESADRMIESGVKRIIIGTLPIKNPQEFERVVDKFRDKIIIGVDVENDSVRISGWVEDTKINHIEFLKKMHSMGIEEAIVTDIKKDGMLTGIDTDFYKNIALKTNLKVIASGGVKDENDINRLKLIEKFGVSGVIVGKAFYENSIDLKKVIEENL